MKICVAQTKPIKGDIKKNIINHKKLIDLAIAGSADMIFFPELSITGYEPELAKELATGPNDKRFDEFQTISDNNNITIAVGMPIKSDQGIMIGMIIFRPGQPGQTYCKQHLHPDEFPYFINGKDQVFLTTDNNKLGLSICYELSVPEHSANLHKNGANIYISSVAKSVEGAEKAVRTLSGIAKQYSMTVLMSNCTGHCDNFDCGGKTSVWNDKGLLLGQLNDSDEGILVFDTITREVSQKII